MTWNQVAPLLAQSSIVVCPDLRGFGRSSKRNLDPESIYDELVPLFQTAKRKRQIIMVTHNANLVVNTDADQVIVAKVGPPVGTGLPLITYSSGGLDEKETRAAVCDILEGSEAAFKDRARRLRISLPN